MGKRSNVCKFPVARIKKIMQADEDVGKVAAATPVVVSKSLEMFIQSILEATHKEAQRTGQRKLTPAHLKAAVHRHETFDFLKEIVETVKDANGSGGGAVAEVGGEASSTGAEPKAKKRKTKSEEDD